MIDYVAKLKIFSNNPTAYNEIIKPKQFTIVNLKGMDPETANIIAFKLLSDLFE